MSAPQAQTLAQATAAETAAVVAAAVPAETAPVEITPSQGNASDANSTVAFSNFWSGIPTSTISSDRGSVSAGDSYADEQSTTTVPQDETGLTEPILSPTEGSAAVRALASSFSLTKFIAVLLVVLGAVAIIGRIMFTLSAARRPTPNQTQSARREHSVASIDEQMSPTLVPVPADLQAGTPYSADSVSSPPRDTVAGIETTDERVSPTLAPMPADLQAGTAYYADSASSPSSDTVAGIERTLQQLLHELERLRHERACRAFESTQKAAA